jgi:AcrR family transcriptional regulator
LIAEQGIDPPTMTEIAARAGMGLTALYRYYPNKQAIVRDLAEHLLDSDRRTLIGPTAESTEPTTLDRLVRDSITAYWHLHRDEPFRLALRAAIYADAELSRLDLDDTRANAALLAGRFGSLAGVTRLDELERRLVMVLSLVDGLLHTAAQVDAAEAEQLVADFCDMVLGYLAGT